jgi:hypothetical protein
VRSLTCADANERRDWRIWADLAAVPKRAGNAPPTGPEPATGRPTQYPFWLRRLGRRL